MYENRHELLTYFRNPVYTVHPRHPFLSTFDCLNKWCGDIRIELPRLSVVIHDIDFLHYAPSESSPSFSQPLRFQQDTYRMWYQIDGHGILQNATRNTFGTARPGLLGVMERGERHTYLHQKGTFSCFLMQFSLSPSEQAKCYWNAGVEGKTTLAETERLTYENQIYSMFLNLSNGKDMLGLTVLSRLVDILIELFTRGLIIIEDYRFPKNKSKSLVIKAKSFMDIHYADLHHQKELEKECGIDINYLNILFKKETGHTLYQYMTDVRMEHAKHLLETTSDSITDIADTIGYPNANSFSRVFKRKAKQTPGEYRLHNIAKQE